ncbi:MAG: hypothetical protein ACREFH_08585, partial [Stellaceae bacterium]
MGRWGLLRAGVLAGALAAVGLAGYGAYSQTTQTAAVATAAAHPDPTVENAEDLVREGRQIFRFDTFGDQAFWGGALQLHKAIEGSAHRGVGP